MGKQTSSPPSMDLLECLGVHSNGLVVGDERSVLIVEGQS